ncbi:MAG: competence/damage-inducible protein A [Gemmataceae bacterium]
MDAEIISIGTELTTGQNLDTNCQWLSQRLAEHGIAVRFHTTIGDNLDDNISAFRIAAERVQLVVITGGLGPTLDDLTRDALAKAANVELVFHQELFDGIAQMFRERSRPMPERNRVQAYLPAGAEPIPNPRGTAPGVWMQLGNSRVAALPGVPSEMREMFEQWLSPRLPRGQEAIWERKINTFGAGESAVEELLKDVTIRGRVPEVGITASEGTISLRIIARAADENAARGVIAPTEAIIRDRLGEIIFGTDREELHEVVARLLVERKLTISVAESITAGQVSQSLARVPGASEWMLGGVVAYTNPAKIKLLGVPEDLLREHGAVSSQMAEAMAIGCREVFISGLAISTTGLAGPGDGGEGKPVGLSYVGVAWQGGVTSHRINWFGTRTEIQNRTAKSALNITRLWLRQHENAVPNVKDK